MPLYEWIDDGSDFGNANGLDTVALDVFEKIAERFGATVAHGKLPDDLLAAHEGREAPEPDSWTQEPYAKLTISWDGLKVSGDSRTGNQWTSGYWSSYWLHRVDADTLVVDLRTVPEDRIVRLAVRGPMTDPTLPPGMVSSISIPDYMKPVADDYLAPYGGLEATTS
jgi:hypothetical protein